MDDIIIDSGMEAASPLPENASSGDSVRRWFHLLSRRPKTEALVKETGLRMLQIPQGLFPRPPHSVFLFRF